MDTSDSSPRLDPLTAFYADALELLVASRLPFLVGGTFAYARYTGIDRETKAEPDHHVCCGTLLSREQYLHDTGGLTRTEATIWTDAIKKDE